MLSNLPAMRGVLPGSALGLWWGIQPVCAGVFGVPAGLVVTVLISLGTGASTPRGRTEDQTPGAA
jgi:cation/acetate symporter